MGLLRKLGQGLGTGLVQVGGVLAEEARDERVAKLREEAGLRSEERGIKQRKIETEAATAQRGKEAEERTKQRGKEAEERTKQRGVEATTAAGVASERNVATVEVAQIRADAIVEAKKFGKFTSFTDALTQETLLAAPDGTIYKMGEDDAGKPIMIEVMKQTAEETQAELGEADTTTETPKKFRGRKAAREAVIERHDKLAAEKAASAPTPKLSGRNAPRKDRSNTKASTTSATSVAATAPKPSAANKKSQLEIKLGEIIDKNIAAGGAKNRREAIEKMRAYTNIDPRMKAILTRWLQSMDEQAVNATVTGADGRI